MPDTPPSRLMASASSSSDQRSRLRNGQGHVWSDVPPGVYTTRVQAISTVDGSHSATSETAPVRHGFPAPPSDFSARTGPDEVALGWDALPGAESYTYCRRRVGAADWDCTDTGSISLAEVKIPDGVEYEFRVHGVRHGAAGKDATITASTTPDAVPCVAYDENVKPVPDGAAWGPG
ncbi:MAG: fibronectin type III domain-containing protein, partial [Gemmatimonadota bacterium]|nr:fibronectin type III domain-containing protein [Gemmatimonadota bacterium]